MGGEGRPVEGSQEALPHAWGRRLAARRMHCIHRPRPLRCCCLPLAGGSVHVCSSMHPSGEALAQIGGLAAVLRFALPDAEEASAPYARAPGTHHHAATVGGAASSAGGGGGGVPGIASAGTTTAASGGAPGGLMPGDCASDSDGSSDSDASYKQAR